MIVKKDSTTLDTRNIEIEKVTEKKVDKAIIEFKFKESLSIGDEIIIYKDDGTTKIFGGNIVNIDKKTIYTAEIIGYGYELNNSHLVKVYENKSPEYIVEDVLSGTNLTYASTESSGVTIEKYIANDLKSKIIDDMSTILDWQVRVDAEKNLYFEPKGNIDNNVTLTNGSGGFRILNWKEDESTIVNDLKIRGDFANYNTSETFSATSGQTEFELSHKPSGQVKVTQNGTELTGSAEDKGDYEVDRENKKIILNTGATASDSIVIYYSYQVPIVVQLKEPESITSYGNRFKQIERRFITSFSDARKYAKQYLETYSEPTIETKAIYPIDYDLGVGEKVTIVDGKREITRELTINKIKYFYGTKKYMEITAGTLEYIIYDWQTEVQKRIKELEKQTSDEDIIMVYRLLNGNVSVTITPTLTKYQRSIASDSMIWGHSEFGKWDSYKWNTTKYQSFIIGSSVSGVLGTSSLGENLSEWVEI